MQKTTYTARFGNIYFLSYVGDTLRWATEDIVQEELPANIKHLLARLDRLEAVNNMDDPVACEGRLKRPANDGSGSETSQTAVVLPRNPPGQAIGRPPATKSQILLLHPHLWTEYHAGI
jgi:hypothetical protein